MDLPRIDLTCIENGRKQPAEVLSCSSHQLRVVLQGTNITITLHRDSLHKPYIGRAANLEFKADGRIFHDLR